MHFKDPETVTGAVTSFVSDSVVVSESQNAYART